MVVYFPTIVFSSYFRAMSNTSLGISSLSSSYETLFCSVYRILFLLRNVFFLTTLFCSHFPLYFDSSLLSLSWLSLYVHLEAKIPILPHLNHLKRSFPLYLHFPLFNLLRKLDSYLSNRLAVFLHSFMLDLGFIVSLNSSSFLDTFWGSILISYDVTIPYSSSLVRSPKSLFSSRTYTFGLNCVCRIIMIFRITHFSSIVSPSHVVEFTISSTLKKYEATSSSSLILRVSNCAY